MAKDRYGCLVLQKCFDLGMDGDVDLHALPFRGAPLVAEVPMPAPP